jgi:CCR4-NOT transcription complex subunit 6
MQANTHINIHHDLKDVKLWQVQIILLFLFPRICSISNFHGLKNLTAWNFLQVHTLLKGLEKIAVSADIPMLVCGDFNSTPGRFVLHQYHFFLFAL